MKPVRVQLSRKKGWHMPPNTVKVDRTTKFGDPYHDENDREHLIAHFRAYLAKPAQKELVEAIKTELRGRNLACWCHPDQPCHADVLLEIANGH
jgi:hypothetical protein